MFVILLIVILVVLAILFGGFQKGTKSGSLSQFGSLGPLASACATTAGHRPTDR